MDKSKMKRRRNWKARQVVETVVDNSESNKIELDIPSLDPNKYDESNALVLPSEKRKTHVKSDTNARKPVVHKLSKKKRKRLAKVLAKKQKKVDRADLFERLAMVQASPDDIGKYLSTAGVQTKGLKRIFEEPGTQIDDKRDSDDNCGKIRSVRGSNKKLKRIDADAADEDDIDGDEDNADEEGAVEQAHEEEIINNDICEGKLKKESLDDNVQNEETINKQTKESSTDDRLADPDKTAASTFSDSRPTIFVAVNRPAEIQESRLKLPILAEEQVIMEAIRENPIIVLCGETGSGKTTQVPQFLYEAGYASGGQLIGVTEPRRVAAVTMSQRVGEEMALGTDRVSYQIRYDGNSTDKTQIKFMTDGVLLKEMQSDFLLTKYSVIIVDEAHERSVYTDILIGLLSRVVPLRNKRQRPLRMIVMSATLKIEDFTENRRLFRIPPPVIKVEARQFPVSVHFNKRTHEDYMSEVYRKVCKIHRQLPAGGILVFVTGQQEVNVICHKLQKVFPFRYPKNDKPINRSDTMTKAGGVEKMRKEKKGEHADQPPVRVSNIKVKETTVLPRISLDEYAVLPLDDDDEMKEMNDDASDVGDLLSDDDDLDESPEVAKKRLGKEEPIFSLPFYSLLPPHRQARVFKPPPEGSRLCVVATNVAETSVTIPNIKYVVDCGKVKTRVYDRVTGVSAFHVTWTSKASANQRAGRAGRTGPGHCYRLYSSAVFNDEFALFSVPEICRRPVDDVVLQLKEMQIDRVLNFPFPTPMDAESIKASEIRLSMLGALETPAGEIRLKHIKKDEFYSKITSLGRAMARFPVSPRYGKMLALSHQHNLLPYVICAVAALTVQEVLMEMNAVSLNSASEKSDLQQRRQRWMRVRKTWAGKDNSLALGDVMVLLKAVGAAEYAGCTSNFCETHGLRYKAMVEMRKLRLQLTNAVNLVIPTANLYIDPKMMPPTDLQAKQLRQIMLSGLPDCIARKVPEDEIKGDEKDKWRKAYKVCNLEEPVFIHPNSVLFRELPEYVVYQEIFETTKMFMRGVTAIEPEWLMVFCADQCTFSKPVDEPAPRYDGVSGTVKCHMSAMFGRSAWTLPLAELEYPLGIDRVRWFARFFLEGLVCTDLTVFRDELLLAPATMIKTWAKLQPKTEIFLKALLSAGVDSREALYTQWKQDKKYLLKEYCDWTPGKLHVQIAELWPPR